MLCCVMQNNLLRFKRINDNLQTLNGEEENDAIELSTVIQ